ncbi:MAG: 50S ribosomal protein L6 [Candidatus Firestonebacteria bacterium GWA2_43_8]|nr:ribosomal protein L6 [uncultured bacterium]OGF52182.1 MAG: 50S ribosomal protein L6 [Candidatus Firestonebacteria bacterium GWA2_43_8]
MARGGNNPVLVPANVKVAIANNVVKVEGPNGKLEMKLPSKLKVEFKDGKVTVIKETEEAQVKSNHGTVRARIAVMIKGVTEQFVKVLMIEGVGFKAAIAGNKLSMTLGFSHPVERVLPAGVTGAVEKNTIITLKSADKEMLGDFAAQIRKIRVPDPYKAKGIKYAGEHIKRKAGKTAGGATGGGK